MGTYLSTSNNQGESTVKEPPGESPGEPPGESPGESPAKFPEKKKN